MKVLLILFAIVLNGIPTIAQNLTAIWDEYGPNSNSALNGQSMATGNIDGDAYKDLIVGVPQKDIVHIYLGTNKGLEQNPSYSIDGSSFATYQYGLALAVGDIDGDGYDDLAISDAPSQSGLLAVGAHGAVYIHYGSSSGPSNKYVKISADGGQRLGRSLSMGGDFDGSGKVDLAIGATYNTPFSTPSQVNGVFVFYGENLPKPSSNNINRSSSNNDWNYQDNRGNAPSFGESVCITGDLSGDGVAELVASAPDFDNDDGRVFVFGYNLGVNPELITYIAGPSGTKAEFGSSLVGLNDINGDGDPDLLIGAPATTNSNFSGKAFIFFGETSASNISMNWNVAGNRDYNLNINGTTDRFGFAAAQLGDINSDGIEDIAVSAKKYNNGNGSEGMVRVFMGTGNSNPPTNYIDIIGSNAGDQLGHAIVGYKAANHYRPGIAISSPWFDHNSYTNNGKVSVFAPIKGNKLYTKCIDNQHLGFDQLVPRDLIEHSVGKTTLLNRKNTTNNPTIYDSRMSISVIDDQGDILNENTYSLPMLSGNLKNSFDPKSFVKIGTDKYIIVGNYHYEYDNGSSIVDRQDVMLISYDDGTINWSNRYQFSTGNGSENVKKIIKFYDGSGSHTHYVVLASSSTHNHEDSRIIKLDLNGNVSWSRNLHTNKTWVVNQYISGYIEAKDIVQVGNGGGIAVAGRSNIIYKNGGPDAFMAKITPNGIFDWIKVYKEMNSPSNYRMDFWQIKYDGNDIVALFSGGVHDGIVHVNPSNGAIVAPSGNRKGIEYNKNLNIRSFSISGSEYYLTGEKSGNILAFHTNTNLDNDWAKFINLDNDENSNHSAINSEGTFWVAGQTLSHSLDCGSSSNPYHLMLAHFELDNGITSTCSDNFDDLNIHDVSVNPYDPSSPNNFYSFNSFTTTSISFDETEFIKSTTVTPSRLVCGYETTGSQLPYQNNENSVLVDMSQAISSAENGLTSDLYHQGNKPLLYSIYPNPATTQLTIEFGAAEGTARIMSINGQEMMAAFNLTEGANQIDIHNLPIGMYVVEIQTADGLMTQKFMKQ